MFSQLRQQLLCQLSTLWHGHQREEAVLPRGEGLRKQPNFPRKDTARSRDKAGVNWSRLGDGSSASHGSKYYVHSPLSGTGTRERKQYCPEVKVCASNLTSHVRTLPRARDIAGVLMASCKMANGLAYPISSKSINGRSFQTEWRNMANFLWDFNFY